MSEASEFQLKTPASVAADAEAVEIAQPRPSKRMSSMRSPCSRSVTVSRSPQSGLLPSAAVSQGSRRPKFRGRLL